MEQEKKTYSSPGDLIDKYTVETVISNINKIINEDFVSIMNTIYIASRDCTSDVIYFPGAKMDLRIKDIADKIANYITQTGMQCQKILEKTRKLYDIEYSEYQKHLHSSKVQEK